LYSAAAVRRQAGHREKAQGGVLWPRREMKVRKLVEIGRSLFPQRRRRRRRRRRRLVQLRAVRRRYPDAEAPFFNILAQPFDMK